MTPRPTLKTVGLCALFVATLLGGWALLDCAGLRRRAVTLLSPRYAAASPSPTEAGAVLRPLRDKSAAPELGEQLPVNLVPVARGFNQITDVALLPARPDGSVEALVAEKAGTVRWLKLRTGVHGKLFSVEVLTASEQGLLGLAIHPRDPHRLFVSSVVDRNGQDVSRVEQYALSNPSDLAHASVKRVRLVLELEQPYANHNGGQIVFGPDGYLYVGFGDGGYRDDPHNHAQRPETWLGSVLRIDVNQADATRGYRVPEDNPLLGTPSAAPETFAFGLRNPWRFSFDPQGRLIVGDVGQDRWEEIDVVAAGDNLGWKLREGHACAVKDNQACERSDLVAPVFVYGRTLGASVTGGFVYSGTRLPELHGRYVFGDFLSGRIFAIRLPGERGQRVEHAALLGKFPILISTFARDPAGELYVADFAGGVVYRIAPPTH